MSEETKALTRNAASMYLTIGKVASVVIFFGGMVVWVTNQSRDIVDARRIADEARTMAISAQNDGATLRLKEAEILVKLAGIEAQVAEVRTILIRRGP
jgi:hypothetical protein